ncbi:MAG: TonB-dependent receptor plug domain-containing protein [Bacteroidota bacterium]|nr:TonB-dependent receptor [Sphingobacteriales bacterium]
MQKRFSCVSILMLLASLQGKGQLLSDSATILKDVSVYATRFDSFRAGSKFTIIDSALLARAAHFSLGDLLAQHSAVFVKTYGPSNISTASFRGSNAEHTAVLWNGFNLQSAMLGLVDLSLIPVDFANQVTIDHGGNGVLFGSGAIGGAIRLQSLPHFGQGMKASVSVSSGSFGYQRLGMQFSFGSRKCFLRIRANNLQAQNNFTYKNTSLAGAPEQRRQNAAVNGKAIQFENHFLINAKQSINFFIWYQMADRQIPSVLSTQAAKAKQFDESIRISSEWSVKSGVWQSLIRVAGFYEVLNFDDPITAIDANSKIKTQISEFELQYRPHKKHVLLMALSNTWSAGQHESFGEEKTLNRIALLASWKYDTGKRFKSNAGIRQEWPDRNTAPLIPFAGVSYQPIPALGLRAQVAGSYRFPTLNERYYAPGGNPDLKPETGWGQEMGADIKQTIKDIKFSGVLTFYNRTVNNWVVWVPSGNFASPRNLRSVWSRGVEMEWGASKKLGKHYVSVHSSINYTATTNQRSEITDDASIGKQLIYIPRLTQQHRMAWQMGAWFVQYLHQYNGMRFIATDNSSWLNDYHVADIAFGYGFKIAKTQFALQGNINNLNDVSYMVLPERPMPGRNYVLTFSIIL